MIYNLLILSVAIFLVSYLLPGIRIKDVWTAVIVALVYSTINFFTGWLLALLTFPLMIVTFGLFKFVINAFLLWITDKLMEDFEINSIGTTLVAACLITLVDSLLHWIF
ncbi:MAG: phage holin family protein [Desulfobacterium sp.]|nr:phage holin family protein [Desulfobacterium sp.]